MVNLLAVRKRSSRLEAKERQRQEELERQREEESKQAAERRFERRMKLKIPKTWILGNYQEINECN